MTSVSWRTGPGSQSDEGPICRLAESPASTTGSSAPNPVREAGARLDAVAGVESRPERPTRSQMAPALEQEPLRLRRFRQPMRG